MENKEYKDCGCANGWYSPSILVNGKWVKEHPDRVPAEVVACREAGHGLSSKKLGNCYYEYSCAICKIKYDVDSSD